MNSNVGIWSDEAGVTWGTLLGEEPQFRITTTVPALLQQRLKAKKKHVESLEVVILCILILRGVLIFSRVLAVLVYGFRQMIRCFVRMSRRVARWRDRVWRRPRYTLRCDLSALEPGTCPVCLAPLAGEASESQCNDASIAPDQQEMYQVEPGLTSDTVVIDGSSGAHTGGATPQEPLFRLRCGHTFHAACIDQWLDRGDTCPLCRAGVGDIRDCVQLENFVAAPLTTPPVRRQARELFSSLLPPFRIQRRTESDVSMEADEPMLHSSVVRPSAEAQSELQTLAPDDAPV